MRKNKQAMTVAKMKKAYSFLLASCTADMERRMKYWPKSARMKIRIGDYKKMAKQGIAAP